MTLLSVYILKTPENQPDVFRRYIYKKKQFPKFGTFHFDIFKGPQGE